MTLHDMMKQEVKSWERLGHPALLQRFVLRNGKPFTPRKRIGRKRRAKACFMNATHFVFDHPDATYVEGFVINRRLPVMPIHHAWVTLDGKTAMDPTLDAEGYEYFGVEIGKDELRDELLKSRMYGVLDTGFGLNWKYMFATDEDLKTICDTIATNRKGLTL